MKKSSKVWILSAGLVMCGALLGLAGCRMKLDPQDTTQNEPPQTVFGEWVTTVEPTCEGEGQQMRVSLTDFNVFETRTIPATGHTWGEWEQETAPTCIVDGVKKRLCSVCDNYDYEPISALGHDWGEWGTGKAATCLSGGYNVRVCTRDEKHLDIEAVEALGHDWGEWVVSLAPTCTQVGSEVHYCRNDNAHKQMRVLTALGHDWHEAVVTKEPTCTAAGKTTQFCRNDSSHTVTAEIPALEHDWSEWVLTKEPTETETGVERRYCANDSTHPETRTLSFLGTKGLKYTLNEEETSYIVSGPSYSSMKELYIPGNHEGLPVLEIADNAFKGYTALTQVVFGGHTIGTASRIEKIGAGAFANSSSLEYFGIPRTVKEIGAQAFAQSGMKLFRIPEDVQSVGAGAFSGWTEEQSIFVAGFASQAEADEAWGAEWRSGCNAVITYETGEEDDYTVVRISNYEANFRARNKENLSGVITIPAVAKGYLIKEIVTSGFASCSNITGIVVEGNILEKVRNGAFANCGALESVQLPESVKEIGANAFRLCASLNSVRIPEGVTSIGVFAFVGCTSLMNITLPASLTSIGKGAFEGWTAEQTIVVRGYANEAEADAVLGTAWREGCNATIIYELEQYLPEGTTEVEAEQFKDNNTLLR
ncbi:MAG: leucine-rich repeat domain-containing protein, partial [Clostridiales bacterium]|nr:leucine-rich repeat domain-containing protein [Clostridiales bacterium]